MKVNDLLFPADFVVLDMEGDEEIPLLLGRPFLATGSSLIDVEMGELMLRFQDEQVVFNIFEAMKHRNENPECYRVDVVDDIVEETTFEESPSLPLQRVIVNSIESSNEDMGEEVDECVQQLAAGKQEFVCTKVESLHPQKEEGAAKEVKEEGELVKVPKLKRVAFSLEVCFSKQ